MKRPAPPAGPGQRAGRDGFDPRPVPSWNLGRQQRWLVSGFDHDKRLYETNPAAITGTASRVLSAVALAALLTAAVVAGVELQWLALAMLLASAVLTVLAPVFFVGAIALGIINGVYLLSAMVVVMLVLMVVARSVGASHARRLGYEVRV